MTDRDLVRLYWPVELRGAFDALFGIDDAMGAVVARATEPALAAIKLAWWRERLEELDAGKVPAEPRLQAATDELLTRSIAGISLAELEDGWAALLEADPDPERVAVRGARLFGMASSLLGIADPMTEMAGRLYALARLGHRPKVPPELAGHRFPKRLRPLSGLAALAARDATRASPEHEGTPGRALALLRHRMTGRIV
jgi:phytoene synthase